MKVRTVFDRPDFYAFADFTLQGRHKPYKNHAVNRLPCRGTGSAKPRLRG